MNITALERKIFNKIKHLQIAEDDINEDNFIQGAFFAGMLDATKIIMNLHHGDLSEHQVDVEIAKLDSYMETVN